MFYRICCRLIFILILFKSFCYTFPATSIDDIPPEDLALLLNESHEQSDIKESNDPDSSIEKPIMNEQNEAYYLKILCALYGSCSADDDNKITKPPIEYDEKKQKRLLSRLFYGFPKFGKRAFASAFDGIPKFG